MIISFNYKVAVEGNCQNWRLLKERE